MIAFRNYVHADKHGTLRIGDTRVSLDSVVYAYLQGASAETIQDQYPALTLEEVYGAITTYLANREEVHASVAPRGVPLLLGELDGGPLTEEERADHVLERDGEAQQDGAHAGLGVAIDGDDSGGH